MNDALHPHDHRDACCEPGPHGHVHDESGLSGPRRLATIISGAGVAIGLACHWLHAPAWTQTTAFIVAVIAGGWFVVPEALHAARRLAPDMNLLMSIAVVGAMFIGAWDEAAAVAFLFSLAELLESYSVTRARRAIGALMEVAPDTALVKRDESAVERSVADVAVGDVVVIKPGARIPLDGVVVSGESSVNQAPITGESMPVGKAIGADVFAGSINERGSLEVRVTRPATDSTLARMIRLVEEAESQRAPVQRFVDRFARYYTPAVMIVAVLLAVAPPVLFSQSWSVSFYRALVTLVIACPCALVIATPVSVVSALTAAARRGVLIKGGAVLEALGRIRAVAMDKTGTITEGNPRVTGIVAFDGTDAAGLLAVAAALESHSEHPVAHAVLEHARREGARVVASTAFQSLTGRGVVGTIDGHRYFAGNHRLVEELAVCSRETERRIEEIERRAQTAVVVGHQPHADCPGEVLGVIAIGDALREGAAAAIERLRDAGVRRVVMLTGDNRVTAEAIAHEAGIHDVDAELLPEEKVARVRELSLGERHVAMVGDGINDAPALAAASVGIAMGVAGTDAALETADVALMADDLGKLSEAIALGRRATRVIHANIWSSIVLKLVFLGLAAAGIATMWMAVAADTGLTLLVIANALRLLRTPGA